MTMLGKLCMMLLVLVAVPAMAVDLGNRQPDKPVRLYQAPPADPAVIRQGGDTIEDAVEIEAHVVLTGSTVGYTDDYDEICPYSGSTSPDVVYRFSPDVNLALDIDLYGSSYDTKVYVYDENMDLVACNDDYYADYTSYLYAVPFVGGVTYYIIIDGYGGSAGEYQFSMLLFIGDVVECPDGAMLEGEPALDYDYVDSHNGGCNSTPPVFQTVDHPVLCGVSGWFPAGGSNNRDTDWFIYTMPADGVLQLGCVANYAMYFFELGPHDCDGVAVLQTLEVHQWDYDEMTILGEAGSEVWFWAGPTVFSSPMGDDVEEFDYTIEVVNVTAVADHSWTRVKELFR